MPLYDENEGYGRLNFSGASNLSYVMRAENLNTMESSLAYGGMIPKKEKGKVVQYFADLKIEVCPGSFLTFRQDVKSGDMIDAYFIFEDGKIGIDDKWHHLPKNKEEFYYQEFQIPCPRIKVQIGIGSGITPEEAVKKFGELINHNNP